MSIIIISVLLLGGIGLLSATILFLTAKKFNVIENPKIEEIEMLLPGANCGGCGFNGCHDFAVNCTKASSLENLICPSSGKEIMDKIADTLGLNAVDVIPQIAVLRCNGTCDNRPRTSIYDGPTSCSIQNLLYVGSTDCAYGCLGEGDCVKACCFDAVKINELTKLPLFDEHKCIGCGMCVDACPRHIIELKTKTEKRIHVACANKDKGATARKQCKSACIACRKCVKECTYNAISIIENVAYIDSNKCQLCGKCLEACPTTAIIATGNVLATKIITKENSEEMQYVENI